jgi:hypothetical protein
VAVRDYRGRAPVDAVAPDAVPADGVPPRLLSGSTLWREEGQQEKAAALRAAFAQDGPADTLAPSSAQHSALLAALAEAALGDPARLSDDELTGAIEAAGRLRNRAHYLETLAVAELARRRAAQYEEDTAAGVARARRRAQFPDLELGAQLLIGRRHAQHLLDEAVELTGRLPRTLARLADGMIDAARASAIASATLCLSDTDATAVDAAVAPTAHEVRADTVARRAAALAMKLDPEAVAREREDAHRTRQRVEARREQSGNASFAIREASTSVVMSVEAAIDQLAVRLRNGGAEGTLDSLRAMAALDRLLNLDPLDRLAPLPPEPAADDGYPGPSDDHDYPEPHGGEHGTSQPGASSKDEGGFRSASGPGPMGGRQARFPALVNLVVPAATLLGWGTAPGQAGAWGLLDPQETRAVVQAASRDPRTRWCFTVVNEQGAAVAHACAPGRHPWSPEPPRPPQHTGDPPDRSQGLPAGLHLARTRQLPAGLRSLPGQEFLARLQSVRVQEFLANLGFTPGAVKPIAHSMCDHRHAEPGYVPSRRLRHLVRARSQSCTAPGCGGQSVHADQDHVVPYPEGPTDECNLHTPCRAHHRAKQSPGWRVEQPEPGILRWTLPSGRVRTARPTIYNC